MSKSRKITAEDIELLSEDLDEDVSLDDYEHSEETDIIGQAIKDGEDEAINNAVSQYSIFLPISKRSVRYELKTLDPQECIPHPLNQRKLSDHNRISLQERIASFKRIGQQKPVLVINIDGKPNIIDGYGRLKTWLYCIEDDPVKFAGPLLKAMVISNSDDVSDKDVIELSKTSNESELLSDWNRAVMYQNMLDKNFYPNLKELCREEGLSYKVWSNNIKLAQLPKKYTQIFVKTAHIPKTFFRKVTAWEKGLANDEIAIESFENKLSELINTVNDYVNGLSATPPYDMNKPTGINSIISQLEDLVPKPVSKLKMVKEKDIEYASDSVKFTSRKSRQNKFSIKFDICDDEHFSKIIAAISDVTGVEVVTKK